LLGIAGLRNVAAEQALDRWGSLSIETLLRNAPKLLIVTAYRDQQASLANTFLEHPALRRMPASLVVLPAKYWSCGIPASLKSVRLLQHAAQSLPQ